VIVGDQFLLKCLEAWVAGETAPHVAPEEAAQIRNGLTLSEGALMPIWGYLIKSLGLSESISGSYLDRLRKYQHFVAANNTIMVRELGQLLEKAQERNIRVMLIKGLALNAAGIYPEKGLRFLSDMDVFIDRPDIPRMEELLDNAEWRPARKEHELHSNHHLAVRSSPRGFPLEVHFGFSRLPLDIDIEQIWSRSKPAKELPTAFIPSIEDVLLQLAFHAALNHPDHLMPFHLRFVADFAFIWKFSAGSLDWKYISQAVERASVRVPFWNTMCIAYKLINPPGMAEVMTNYNAGEIADNSFVDMAVSRLRDGHRSAELSWLVALAAEEKNPFRRLFKSFEVVFPPRAYMAEAYPEWASFPWFLFAYAARIFKVLRNFNLRNYLMAYQAGKMARRVGDPENDPARRD